MKRKTRCTEKASQAKDELPDLSLPLPFVHCKIVFNLKKKVSDKVDCERFQDQSSSEGWKFENNRYVYYETVSPKKHKMNNNEKPGKQTGSQMADTSEESRTDTDNDDIFTASFLKLINRKEKKEASQKFDDNKFKKRLNEVKVNTAAVPTSATSGRCRFQKMTSNFFTSTKDANCDGKTLRDIINAHKTTEENSSTQSNAAETPFKCTNCSKTFANKWNLKIHHRIHTGEKPHKCLKCSKMFAHSASLSRHTLIHSDVKPFHCSECSQQFSDPSTFKRHMRIHTGERPFKCSECMKAFSHSSNLNRHMRVHTGEKLFQCSVCLQRFSDPSSLKRHNLSIHKCKTPQLCSNFSKRLT